jgi:hypothetical protein
MTTPDKRPPFDFKAMAALVQSGLDHGGVACESCDADLALRRMGDRVFVMEIQHDDDCPVLAYHQRNHS